MIRYQNYYLIFKTIPTRPPFYPGIQTSYNQFFIAKTRGTNRKMRDYYCLYIIPHFLAIGLLSAKLLLIKGCPSGVPTSLK